MNVNNTGLFFVHYFAKNCTLLDSIPVAAANCSPVEAADPMQGDPALRDMYTIGLRDYIAPGTQRGPDPALLLTPRILMFTLP